MHRVELKATTFLVFKGRYWKVPNAPCGVERSAVEKAVNDFISVPNAPCGVESFAFFFSGTIEFRVPNAPCGVERQQMAPLQQGNQSVPNAPCGVESEHVWCRWRRWWTFLMHRVELKAWGWNFRHLCGFLFLMHRVELKDKYIHSFVPCQEVVPNAPCGVESQY